MKAGANQAPAFFHEAMAVFQGGKTKDYAILAAGPESEGPSVDSALPAQGMERYAQRAGPHQQRGHGRHLQVS